MFIARDFANAQEVFERSVFLAGDFSPLHGGTLVRPRTPNGYSGYNSKHIGTDLNTHLTVLDVEYINDDICKTPRAVLQYQR